MLCHPWPDHTLAVDGLTCWQCRIGKGVWLSHRHTGIKRHFNLLPPSPPRLLPFHPLNIMVQTDARKGRITHSVLMWSLSHWHQAGTFTHWLVWSMVPALLNIYNLQLWQITLCSCRIDFIHKRAPFTMHWLLLSHHCCLTAHCEKACFQWAMNCGQQFKIGFVVHCCAAVFFTLSIQDGFTASQQDVVK